MSRSGADSGSAERGDGRGRGRGDGRGDERGDGQGWHFTVELWKWQGNAAWHFVTLPFAVTDEIDELTHGRTNGFGSVRVKATVGRTTWVTSVFPDKGRESFILPVKAAVRKAEGLAAGSPVTVHLQLE